jgi:aminoglycoside phosphotransferase (APT) family kinase protein
MKAEQIAAALPDPLCAAWGAERVTVANLRRMTGGASRETWALDVGIERPGQPAEARALVLRGFQKDSPQAMDARAEYTVLGAAVAGGVPAPRPLLLDETLLEMPFYLMERIAGETIGRRLIKDSAYVGAREVMTEQLGRILAGIHRIALTPEVRGALPPPPAGSSPALCELDRYEATYRTVTPDPHPAFELALRWLRRNAPDSSPVAFTHGDYRVGNIIFGPEGVRAVLDWELAHAGDPMEDLGWICVRSWRFGGEGAVGGIGTREEFFAAYEAAGGCPVDPARVHWWEVFGNLRWGVITLSLSQTFLDGRNPGVEPASIGRRTAETEWELLELMSNE